MPEKTRQRLDQWLYHARFLKTRTLAGALCKAGRIRIDGEPCHKASTAVRPGQVLTFPQSDRIRIVKVTRLAKRRGPASEARGLYEDLTPAHDRLKNNFNPRPAKRTRGSGRPTKKERRATDALKR